MKNVKVQYRILGIKKTKEIQVPERWDQMNADQFSVCASMHVKPVTEVEFISRFFCISKYLVKKFNKFEIYKLSQLAQFAAYPTGSTNFFFIKHIPGIFKLLAPEPKLRNVSFEQFAIFDTLFFEYAYESTPENLYRFVAMLYTFDGEEVTKIEIDRRVTYFKKHVDDATLHAIYLNYVFIRKWLSKSFPFLFDDAEKSMQTKRITTKPKSNKKNLPDWNGILDAVIGDDVLHYKDYRKTPCVILFKTVNNKIKDFRNGNK